MAERLKRGINKIPAENAFGHTVIEADGLNHARLLSSLSAICDISGITENGRKLTFRAPSRYAPKIIALLDNLCYNYKIINTEGLAPSAIRVSKRVGVLAGLALTVCALIVYPRFITAIEIDAGALSGSVSDILNEYGVTRGSFLWRLDETEVSARLLQLDGAAFASVERRGTRVYVKVKEELDGDHIITIPSGAITSKHRAVVTRTVVYAGTAAVVYGDVVSPGDVLIGDYIEVGEEKVPSNAAGEVYGKLYRSKTLYFPDVEIVTRTGRIKKYTRLSFFGSKTKTPESPFEVSSVEFTQKRNEFLFPYTIRTWTFTELISEERPNTRSEEQMKKETLSSIVSELPPSATVGRVWYESREGDGGIFVTAYIETEERIDL